MAGPDETDGSTSETREAILRATFRALCEDGYADLSIASIAEEFEKSKSLLYYHYDSKDDLLVAFLEDAIDRFLADVEADIGGDPGRDLDHVVDRLLPEHLDGERREAQAVIVELRCQAISEDAYRDHFTEADDRIAEIVERIIERGVESGTFEDADPTPIAEYVVATANGAMYGRATTDRGDAVAVVRSELRSYLDHRLGRSR